RVRITATEADDAIDLGTVQLSADGSIVAFIRGHTPNFKGQIGNQGSYADGGRREVWAAPADGSRPPWRVTEARDMRLSPDGKWVLHVKDGQIYRAAVEPAMAEPDQDDIPLFTTLGVNSNPTWSPDGSRIAFVTARYDQRQYFPTQGHV